jgi:hypothetical protein
VLPQCLLHLLRTRHRRRRHRVLGKLRGGATATAELRHPAPSHGGASGSLTWRRSHNLPTKPHPGRAMTTPRAHRRTPRP